MLQHIKLDLESHPAARNLPSVFDGTAIKQIGVDILHKWSIFFFGSTKNNAAYTSATFALTPEVFPWKAFNRELKKGGSIASIMYITPIGIGKDMLRFCYTYYNFKLITNIEVTHTTMTKKLGKALRIMKLFTTVKEVKKVLKSYKGTFDRACAEATRALKEGTESKNRIEALIKAFDEVV